MVFLTTDELKVLESHQFTQPRLQQVKDWFVFSCYTGLAYNDVPMEIVSQLLGHSSITITEDSFNRVDKKNVSEGINELN